MGSVLRFSLALSFIEAGNCRRFDWAHPLADLLGVVWQLNVSAEKKYTKCASLRNL